MAASPASAPVMNILQFWPELVLIVFLVAAVFGCGVARVTRSYVVFVWALSFYAVSVAHSFIYHADPAREYEGALRALVVGPPLLGWLFGLAVGSVWVLARWVAGRRAVTRP
jgi:steroid 5-alpha reductase family enzyme